MITEKILISDNHVLKYNKLYFATLFRRAEEGYNLYCAINTWTSTRYIEYIVLEKEKEKKW